MKKVKLFIITLFILFSSKVYSQFNYGIEAGYLRNQLKIEEKAGNSKHGNGFKAGGIVSYHFENNIILESGLSYQQKKGSLSKLSLPNDINAIENIKMEYLNLPITVGYRFKIEEFGFSINTGGYIACGVGGTAMISGKDVHNQPYSSAIDIFKNENLKPISPFNRVDAGIICGANIDYRHLQVRFNYEIGLTPVSPVVDHKNRTLSIALAYFLKPL